MRCLYLRPSSRYGSCLLRAVSWHFGIPLPESISLDIPFLVWSIQATFPYSEYPFLFAFFARQLDVGPSKSSSSSVALESIYLSAYPDSRSDRTLCPPLAPYIPYGNRQASADTIQLLKFIPRRRESAKLTLAHPQFLCTTALLPANQNIVRVPLLPSKRHSRSPPIQSPRASLVARLYSPSDRRL